MHHFLKTVLLSCALLTLGAMPSQSAESLRCVSAANPSGTWYIGICLLYTSDAADEL